MKKHFENESEQYLSFRTIDGTDARKLLDELSKKMTIRHAEADEDELLLCVVRDGVPCSDGGLIVLRDAVAEIAETEFMWFSVSRSFRCERYVGDIANNYDLDRLDARGLLEQIEETINEIDTLADNEMDYATFVRYENLKDKIDNLDGIFNAEINALNRVRAMLQWDIDDTIEYAEYNLEHSGAAV